MAKINCDWTVGPHGPVERLEEDVLTVAGEIRMPLGNFPRRMTAVALLGGRIAIWSPIALREDAMAEIEALGEPAFLIVPGVGHRLDLLAWKKRYPAAKVVCAPGARSAVEEIVPVDATSDIFGDGRLRLEIVPGAGQKEAALGIWRDGRMTLVVNDILANVRHPRGIGAWIMARLFGFGVRRPSVPWLVRRRFVKDKAALGARFRRWSRERALTRIVVSHGDVIDAQPQAVLARIADALDPPRVTAPVRNGGLRGRAIPS